MIAYLQTIGAQHEAIDRHMKEFISLEFGGAGSREGRKKNKDEDEEQALGHQEVEEMVTLHFQLVTEANAKQRLLDSVDENSEAGALVPQASRALSLFGGSVGNSQELKAEVERTRQWMASDPRRRQLRVSARDRDTL